MCAVEYYSALKGNSKMNSAGRRRVKSIKLDIESQGPHVLCSTWVLGSRLGCRAVFAGVGEGWRQGESKQAGLINALNVHQEISHHTSLTSTLYKCI